MELITKMFKPFVYKNIILWFLGHIPKQCHVLLHTHILGTKPVLAVYRLSALSLVLSFSQQKHF